MWKILIAGVLALLLIQSPPIARTTATGLDALSPFLGTWEGSVEAPEGEGEIRRVYRHVVEDRFIMSTSHVQFADSSHEDLGMWSYDTGRKLLVLREYHSEGFVNTYRTERNDDGELVMVTEAVENGPKGLRARLTLTLVSDDEIEELFELARPGADFEPCVTAHLYKVEKK